MLLSTAIGDYLATNQISIRALAVKTGLPIATVSASIFGARPLSSEEYVRICVALGVSYNYFFRDAYRRKGETDEKI